ncbi:MAG: alanine--tRNA ligase-related protein, partial [Nitrospinota bacterium]|nr:alanine--tRNA ligase-related protein [Nitrospinota bacterium]
MLRRALRHGRMLGQEKPFLHKIAGRVIELMKDAYPELIDMENYISKVVLNEEERFSNTLNFGMNLLEEKIKKLKENSQKTFPGDEVFKLYDTYGFPVDLSEDIVNDAGLKFDSAGFQKAMDSQKDKARAAWKGSGEEGVKKIYKTLSEKIPPSQFEGFDALKTEGTLLAIIKKDSITESASSGDEIDLVFDKTVFYGESGGQVGDAGKISGDSIEIQVLTTHKPLSSLFVHSCKIKSGIIKKGVGLTLQVDMEDRQATALNHTATHLLQAALKEVLGDHVKQAGSLVEKNRFRFDYTHFSPLTSREKEKIEEIVNQKIMENIPVQKKTMPIDEAIKEG